jgi:hypothetical protein
MSKKQWFIEYFRKNIALINKNLPMFEVSPTYYTGYVKIEVRNKT